MHFSQIPANLGNYVVVNDMSGDGSAGSGFVWTYAVGTSGMPLTSANAIVEPVATVGVKGTLFKDLGVTYVEEYAANKSMSNVYRKVVKVSDLNTSADPTEVFIKVVNATASTPGSVAGNVQFARFG